MREWRELMEERGTRTDKPMKPQVVAWELGKRLRDDAIVSCDTGTIATWFARQIPARRGQMYSLSGTLASMANGLPYAIAAQIAYPERQCVAFVGDGGFSMLMAEFATAVKYRLPIKVVVDQEQHARHDQVGADGLPGQPGVRLRAAARSTSPPSPGRAAAPASRIEDPAECGAILDEALATPGPVLVEAVVDPFEPPMPPKVTLEQATKFAEVARPRRAEPRQDRPDRPPRPRPRADLRGQAFTSRQLPTRGTAGRQDV